jgi:oligopeptide transport system substrate-binding protein
MVGVKLSKRYFRVFSLAAVLLLLLTGCWPFSENGGGPSPTQTASLTPGTTGTPPVDAPSTPGEGVTPLPSSNQALNIAGQTTDPPTLDPALATDSYSLLIVRQLFSGLVTFDNDLKVVPDAAAAMPSVSADGLTYTFVIRDNVKFTDQQAVTALDFKYSFERATDPKLAGSLPATQLPAGLYFSDIVGVKEKLEGKASDISGVKAPDPHTLQITIDSPDATFLSKLASGPAYAVERSNVEEGEGWTEHPRGTGPFRLAKWVHNQQMVLSRNPDYFGGAPSLASINVWMGANATGELQQYEVGGLDVAEVPTDDLERVTDRNNPMSKELQSVPDLSVTYLAFNLRQKPFEDPKIREALARVIDRQKIARVMFQSRVRQAYGFIPPNMAGYASSVQDEGLDVTKARQLIAESTYKDVKNLPKMRLYTSGDLVGPMLQDVFSNTLGIPLEVHEVEWSDYLEGLDRHEYPMFTLSWNADYPDPEGIIGSLFRSDSPENQTGYRNADVDAALDAAARETNQQRRMATFAQVEQRIVSDYPAVPLYHSVSYTLVKPYVQGLTVTPMGILSLKNVRVAAH